MKPETRGGMCPDNPSESRQYSCVDVSNTIISWSFYLNSGMPRCEKEIVIRRAAANACRSPNGNLVHFSLNDVYREIKIGDSFRFIDRKGVLWHDRFKYFPRGIVQYVLMKEGYKTEKRSGGANVCRYYWPADQEHPDNFRAVTTHNVNAVEVA